MENHATLAVETRKLFAPLVREPENNIHHAKDDAEAAGRVLLAMMQYANVTTPRELLEKTGIEPTRFRQ